MLPYLWDVVTRASLLVCFYINYRAAPESVQLHPCPAPQFTQEQVVSTTRQSYYYVFLLACNIIMMMISMNA